MSHKSCVAIHFDSLGGAVSSHYRNPADPSFFHTADLFFELSDKYHLKYTIFIIGKDLENPKIAERVKEWSRQGHEIGNHSYSHKENLGHLNYNELETEVMKSHEIIAKVCGKEPKGFIATSWATSPALIKILVKHGYLYDTSVFPSYFMWLLLAKIWWDCKNPERRKIILQRHDWLANLFASNKPYYSDGTSLIKKSTEGLLIIPLPTTPIFRIPCWHSMAFVFPDSLFKLVLGTCLKQQYFYYVTHPMDLLDKNDIPDWNHNRSYISRRHVPLEEKMCKMDMTIKTIAERSSDMVTLKEIAEELTGQK